MQYILTLITYLLITTNLLVIAPKTQPTKILQTSQRELLWPRIVDDDTETEDTIGTDEQQESQQKYQNQPLNANNAERLRQNEPQPFAQQQNYYQQQPQQNNGYYFQPQQQQPHYYNQQPLQQQQQQLGGYYALQQPQQQGYYQTQQYLQQQQPYYYDQNQPQPSYYVSSQQAQPIQNVHQPQSNYYNGNEQPLRQVSLGQQYNEYQAPAGNNNNSLTYSERQWEHIKRRGGNTDHFSVSNGKSQYSCRGAGRYKRQSCPGFGLGGGGGGGGGGAACFSADMHVQLVNGEMKKMDELKVGDWVLSINNSALVYSRVKSWIHKVPSQRAEFLRIEMEEGKAIKITPKHFIYKTKCSEFQYERIAVEWIQANAELVLAEQVKPGDCLLLMEEATFNERKVERVDSVVERGIFSPMTETGNIVVEDLLASCYSIEPNSVLQNGLFGSTIASLLSHSQNEEQIDLPFWVDFMVDYILPAVLPTK